MKTVACRIDLGYTRIAGYTLFDQDTAAFDETTPKEVESLLKRGTLNGLVFDTKGGIVPDLEGWNLGNLKIKSGVGNYRNFNMDNPKGDTVFSVVRVVEVEGIGRIYETINNRCARVFYTEKQLLALMQFNWVGGVKFNEETNEITICKGVKMDKSDNSVFELGTKVLTKEQLQEATMAELFNGTAAAEGAAAEGEPDKPADEGALPFESDTAMQPVSVDASVDSDTGAGCEQEENSLPAALEAAEDVAGDECTEPAIEQAEEPQGVTEEPADESEPEAATAAEPVDEHEPDETAAVEPTVEPAPDEAAVSEPVAEPEQEDGEQNWQPKSSYKSTGSKSSKKRR